MRYPKLFTIPEGITTTNLNDILTEKHLWESKFEEVKKYVKDNKTLPKKSDENSDVKLMGRFVKYSIKYYKSQEFALADEHIKELWKTFIEENPELFQEKENLQEKFNNMTSQELCQHFKTKRSDWYKYHEDYPDNKDIIIDYINNRKTKHVLHIADLGCGTDLISEKCKKHKFLNFDNVAINNNVKECDITKTPLDDESMDIVILHKSIWGSNKEDYLTEAHRILEDNGTLLLTGNVEEKKITKLGFMIKNQVKIDDCKHFQCVKS